MNCLKIASNHAIKKKALHKREKKKILTFTFICRQYEPNIFLFFFHFISFWHFRPSTKLGLLIFCHFVKLPCLHTAHKSMFWYWNTKQWCISVVLSHSPWNTVCCKLCKRAGHDNRFFISKYGTSSVFRTSEDSRQPSQSLFILSHACVQDVFLFLFFSCWKKKCMDFLGKDVVLMSAYALKSPSACLR